jgi:hypothetical protein
MEQIATMYYQVFYHETDSILVAGFVRIRFFGIEGSLKSYDFSYLGVEILFRNPNPKRKRGAAAILLCATRLFSAQTNPSWRLGVNSYFLALPPRLRFGLGLGEKTEFRK